MVFNATFNNISVILWRLVLLVEYLEKTTNLSQVTDKLWSNNLSGDSHHKPNKYSVLFKFLQQKCDNYINEELFNNSLFIEINLLVFSECLVPV
jgi:hypothetical protein